MQVLLMGNAHLAQDLFVFNFRKQRLIYQTMEKSSSSIYYKPLI